MTTAMLEPTTRVDGDEPSRALGEMPYGLYIVGSKSDEGPNGMDGRLGHAGRLRPAACGSVH
jgi:hypothetical protein